MVVELTAAGSIVSVVCVHDTVVCVGSSKQQRMQHASRQTFLATCVCARCKFFPQIFVRYSKKPVNAATLSKDQYYSSSIICCQFCLVASTASLVLFLRLVWRRLLPFWHRTGVHTLYKHLGTCSCSCSLAVLDPRVGHTMDVLSPFIPVLCHSD